MSRSDRPFLRRPKMFEPAPDKPAVYWIKVGYLTGQGLSSSVVAQAMNDGATNARGSISAESLRHMLQKADLPSPGRRRVILPMNLESWERDMLQRHADERKITVHELLYRFIREGLILAKPGEDLYDAVTDGAYD